MIAILNITSWETKVAEHLYADYYFTDSEDVTSENFTSYAKNHWGEKREVKRQLTLEGARQLDRHDGGNLYEDAYRNGVRTTTRFYDFHDVINEGVKIFKEQNVRCDFLILFKKHKYKIENDLIKLL